VTQISRLSRGGEGRQNLWRNNLSKKGSNQSFLEVSKVQDVLSLEKKGKAEEISFRKKEGDCFQKKRRRVTYHPEASYPKRPERRNNILLPEEAWRRARRF